MWFTDKMFRSDAYLVLRRFSFRTLAPVLVIRLLAPAGVKMFVLLCDDFSPALLLLQGLNIWKRSKMRKERSLASTANYVSVSLMILMPEKHI